MPNAGKSKVKRSNCSQSSESDHGDLRLGKLLLSSPAELLQYHLAAVILRIEVSLTSLAHSNAP
jgi:hypothetical protein